MLKVEDLQFSYGNSSPKFRYDLDAQAGEITTIFGDSGSGKSTFFDLIAGFLVAQSGDIRLNDTSLLRQDPAKRPISILFQKDNLFEHLSALENVVLGLDRQQTNRKEMALQSLAELGLSEHAHRKASQLSGGQQQRVALARTLVRNRPILLLDEPFTGLDEERASELRALIKSYTNQKGWITILVSHDQEDRDPNFCDAIYRMADGYLTQI